MVTLPNYLNKIGLNKTLSLDQFESSISQLAEELTEISFYPNYSDAVLLKSWKGYLKKDI